MTIRWIVPLVLLVATTAVAGDKKDPAAEPKPARQPGSSDLRPAGPEELPLGRTAPEFSLPGVDGKTYTLKEARGEKGTLVVFTCNHCPYAKAYQERLIALTAEYAKQGIGVVAISSNDVAAYPDDDFPKMKERAAEMKYNFPYLFDGTQSVALAYGPKVTPHVFLFDAKNVLVYRGRIDDSAKPAEVKTKDLAVAMDQLIAGTPIALAETKAFGCGIKWKPGVGGAKKSS